MFHSYFPCQLWRLLIYYYETEAMLLGISLSQFQILPYEELTYSFDPNSVLWQSWWTQPNSDATMIHIVPTNGDSLRVNR